MKLISIITTVYNEEDCVNEYIDEIINLNKIIKDYKLELIFINNGSGDNTYNQLIDLKKKYNWIKIISLVRNFGYQNALYCGLENSKGDLIFMVDVDLEDPPSLLTKFIKIIEDGYQIAYGIRDKREENFLLVSMRKLWYKIFNLLSDHNSILYMSEYALITNKVKDVILSNNSGFVFIRNEISYSGYKSEGVNYYRKKRKKGTASSSSFIYILQFAMAGIIDSTTKPLRIVSLTTAINIFFSFLFLTENFKDIFIILTIINTLFSVSIISIYIARIKNDLSNKKKYIIDRINSFF
jgi:polyisoprenyl-phosphate glycosyltransferase